MKKSRVTESQILAILKQAENGMPVTEFCHQHGMSSAAFYKWRTKYGGMDASLMAQMKELERKNARLTKIHADAQLQTEAVQEVLAKSSGTISACRDCQRSRVYARPISRLYPPLERPGRLYP